MVSETDKYLASWGTNLRISKAELETKTMGSPADSGIDAEGSQMSWVEARTLIPLDKTKASK